MAQKITVTLQDAAAYDKYVKEVKDGGGVIVHDNKILLSFTAEIPDQVLELLRTDSLQDSGIIGLEADSIVTIQ